jgi:hypothetical protein
MNHDLVFGTFMPDFVAAARDTASQTRSLYATAACEARL